MKVSHIINEGIMKKVKDIADSVLDELADQKHFSHQDALARAKVLLSRDPEFKDNPTKIKAALSQISDYIK